jgi:allantoate deiminase
VGGSVDGGRLLAHLDELAASARGPKGGITRLAWSPEDLAARALLRSWLPAELTISEDAVGNVLAELPGSVAGLAPLATGSHLDTVTGGGALDGAYGVVAALEAVLALVDAGERLRHPLRAVAWANEEGVVAPPFTGSRAAAGLPVDLAAVGPDGITLADRLAAAGGDPGRVSAARWRPLAGYLELHIEQGPVLDWEGRPVGVVTAITGTRRGTVTARGRANHAGTTPMGLRADALAALAPLVGVVQGLATQGPADVATVGRLSVEPGNGNVVPALATMSFDVRSVDDRATEAAVARLRAAARARAEETGVGIVVSEAPAAAAVATDARLRAAVTDAASGRGLPTLELPSGAGHDAQHVAALGPIGMVFVPSRDGVSHSGAEFTPPAQLVDGAEVLLDALRLADERLDG